MKNGLIYPFVAALIAIIKRLNLVEYVKEFCVFAVSKFRKTTLQQNEIIATKNVGIDIFILLKWGFIAWAIIWQATSPWVEWAVWYLIFTNLFTYFYYHVWGSGFVARSDIDSQRRRFINFLISLGFYLVCYAYLYQFQYATHISWPNNAVDFTNATYLSIANAFTLTYGGFAPISQTARILFASELINTFFFFTIIIVNSVPNTKNAEK